MATNFGIKLFTPPSFVVMAFLNRLEDRNSNIRILSVNDLCINVLYKFGNIGRVTPEITRVEIETFGMIGIDWRLPPNISENTVPIFTKFSELIHIDPVQIINMIFFAVV